MGIAKVKKVHTVSMSMKKKSFSDFDGIFRVSVPLNDDGIDEWDHVRKYLRSNNKPYEVGHRIWCRNWDNAIFVVADIWITRRTDEILVSIMVADNDLSGKRYTFATVQIPAEPIADVVVVEREKCSDSGKVVYDKSSALRAIKAAASGRNRHNIPVRCYPCDHCGGWHLTSKQRGREKVSRE